MPFPPSAKLSCSICEFSITTLAHVTCIELNSDYFYLECSNYQKLYTTINNKRKAQWSHTNIQHTLQQCVTVSIIEQKLEERTKGVVHDLAGAVDCLQSELNNREPELLRNYLESYGIPETKGDDPVHTATLIGSKLGECDVDSVVHIDTPGDCGCCGCRFFNIRAVNVDTDF
ncbi:hypothetical protein EVAR_27596_1 [Eumeta japonica]|uniref:Uncharacterized protein n=1 Tax=Eumeta variegata TaxID=151549 RepID=A0A4C1SHU5_EUMVA|nr:hypothetical protein EVAR_27596_1 [Eumeta japonica]